MCNHMHLVEKIYEYLNSLKETKEYSILSSATLNKITEITNQYFADNNIYIKRLYPVISKKYCLPSRGSNRNIRIVAYPFYYIYKLYVDSLIKLKYFDYSISSEYKYNDLKIDMENYYITIITKKSNHITI